LIPRTLRCPWWAAEGRPVEPRVSFVLAQAKATGIFDVALRVFLAADEKGVSPAVSADRLAEERIRSVGWLPR
jgi:hypothetical protein